MKVNKISFKVFFAVYGIALVVCLGLQTMLKLTIMSPRTGFYDGNQIPVIALYAVIIVSILFWFLATMLRGARHDFALNYKHHLTSLFSILSGLSILAYTIFDVTNQVMDPLISPFREKLSIFLAFGLGILAAVSMIAGGIQPTYGRYGKPGAILGVIPCVWQLVLLLSRFNRFIAITKLSDVLFNVLFMCFATVFLLGQARIIYGLGIRNGRSYAFPFGMAMSLLGLTFVVPNFIYVILNGGASMPGIILPMSEAVYILVLSIYAPIFLFGFSKSIYKV